jgi:hypothetical protein
MSMLFTELKLYNADVQLYERNVNSEQHLGLIIHYLDNDEDEGLPASFIYQADNINGKSISAYDPFTPKFKTYEGAHCSGLATNVQVSKTAAESFCKQFNSNSRSYNTLNNNSQTFVNELKIHLQLSNVLPPMANLVEKSPQSKQQMGK